MHTAQHRPSANQLKNASYLQQDHLRPGLVPSARWIIVDGQGAVRIECPLGHGERFSTGTNDGPRSQDPHICVQNVMARTRRSGTFCCCSGIQRLKIFAAPS